MPDFIANLTELEALQYILYVLSTLLCMRIVDWIVHITKFLYRFFSSFFPTDIPKS